MLCKMACWLSGKVVAIYWDNTTVGAYLCNQGGTAYTFHSRLACYILYLADMHGINLPLYLPTHLSVEADYLSRGRLVPE